MKKTITSNIQLLGSASTLPLALLVANFASFAFNAYLGRVLSFSDFGVITLLNSFWYLLSIPINALGGTITHKVAYLIGKEGETNANTFFVYFSKIVFTPVIIATILWVLLTPILAEFFHIQSLTPILLFGPSIYAGTYSIVNRGFLQGKFLYLYVSLTIIVENVSRLLLAIFFVTTNLSSYTYLSIPLSILLAYLFASWYIKRKPIPILKNQPYTFPKKFFTANLLSNISTTAFITIDVILVKHFFSETIAGQYALLSLIGKMIYFFGTMLNSILFTHVSHSEGAKQNSRSVFNKILFLSSLATFTMFIFLGPLGSITSPILFGDKIDSIGLYLTPYALGISLFTIANIISVYHLAKQNFIFSSIGIVATILLTLGISFFHASLLQITYSIVIVSLISLMLTIGLHLQNTYKNE